MTIADPERVEWRAVMAANRRTVGPANGCGWVVNGGPKDTHTKTH